MKGASSPAMNERTVEETIDASTLFRSHAAFVARFLVRLGAPAAEIEDLVQEVFMVAHRRGGFVAGPARPTTWLAEIAVRVRSTARRAERRRKEEPDEAEVASVATTRDPSKDAEVAQNLRHVQEALGMLDPDKRAIFVLFELEDEPCDAIAAALGVPIGTVYSRLHAARREFMGAYRRIAEPRPSARRERHP